MPSISYDRSGAVVDRLIETGTQTATVSPWRAYRQLRVSLNDGKVANDGVDIETVTVEIVDGLEVARGTAPSNATVLDEDATATLTVDGAEVTVSLTSGAGTEDITTTKSAPSTIDIEAVGVDTGPVEPDSATIEVTQA